MSKKERLDNERIEFEALKKKQQKEATQKAEQIIKEAEEYARQIQGASLEYVDEMLLELSIAAKKAKENMRIVTERLLEDFDVQIDTITKNQQDIYQNLLALSENGNRPVRKADYNIKVDEEFIRKQGYSIKVTDGESSQVVEHKPAKQPFEIKIADEWKSRVEEMTQEREQALREADTFYESAPRVKEPKVKQEPVKVKVQETANKTVSPVFDSIQEEKEEYSSADFDLDSEYFSWLEEIKGE